MKIAILNRRWRSYLVAGILIVCTVVLYRLSPYSISKDNVYTITKDWVLMSDASKKTNVANSLYMQVFSQNVEAYFLSAIASRDKKDPDVLNIVLTGLDSTRGNGHFFCCVLHSDKSLVRVRAKFYNIHHHIDFLPLITQYFNQAPLHATQYLCQVSIPSGGVSVQNISLSPTATCSKERTDYLPVKIREEKPDGLAVCAKIAFGDQLKASRLVEWFEMQKLLGVDKILLFDMECPTNIKAVFKHYIEEGSLEVQPYSLPGEVPGYPNFKRGFVDSQRIQPQVSHDEHLSVLDCHQRLGGYQYIVASDFDEIIVPRKELTLKELLKKLSSQNPKSAGFYFYVQFYLLIWERKRNDTDIYMQQYLTSTKPRWECEKYVYLPSRAFSASTHFFIENSPYTYTYVDPQVATIHHYRQCPHGWDTCYPPVIFDNSVLKYENQHTANTHKVLQTVGLKSNDDLSDVTKSS